MLFIITRHPVEQVFTMIKHAPVGDFRLIYLRHDFMTRATIIVSAWHIGIGTIYVEEDRWIECLKAS